MKKLPELITRLEGGVNGQEMVYFNYGEAHELLDALRRRAVPESLRPEVLAFAQAMEAELKRHDAKRGGNSWQTKTCSTSAIVNKLLPKAKELMQSTCENSPKAHKITQKLAADVANYAMIMWDLLARCESADLQAPEPPSTSKCPRCGGSEIDPLFGYMLPCPICKPPSIPADREALEKEFSSYKYKPDCYMVNTPYGKGFNDAIDRVCRSIPALRSPVKDWHPEFVERGSEIIRLTEENNRLKANGPDLGEIIRQVKELGEYECKISPAEWIRGYNWTLDTLGNRLKAAAAPVKPPDGQECYLTRCTAPRVKGSLYCQEHQSQAAQAPAPASGGVKEALAYCEEVIAREKAFPIPERPADAVHQAIVARKVRTILNQGAKAQAPAPAPAEEWRAKMIQGVLKAIDKKHPGLITAIIFEILQEKGGA